MNRVEIERLKRSAEKPPFESKTGVPHRRNKYDEARIDEKFKHPDIVLLAMLAHLKVMPDVGREARQIAMWSVCMAYITLAMENFV